MFGSPILSRHNLHSFLHVVWRDMTGILVVATLEVLYALLTICGIIFLKNVLPFMQEQVNIESPRWSK